MGTKTITPKTIFITMPRRGVMDEGCTGRLAHILKATPGSSLTGNDNVPRASIITPRATITPISRASITPISRASITPISSHLQHIKREHPSIHHSLGMATCLLTSTSTLDGIVDDDEDEDEDDATGGLGPRKRRRLTNLSSEERMMRRKLKNRVAAQTARDRKKARMDELEILVTKLENENTKLVMENEILLNKTSELNTENVELRSRLNMPDGDGVIMKKEVDSCESAALAVPLQQEPTHPRSPLVAQILTMLMTLSLMSCSTYSKRFVVMEQKLQQLITPQIFRQLQRKIQSLNQRKWWGPQQSSWNPSMN